MKKLQILQTNKDFKIHNVWDHFFTYEEHQTLQLEQFFSITIYSSLRPHQIKKKYEMKKTEITDI